MKDQALKIPVNDKKTINGWAFFDWANSSYALVIAVAIFPNYFIRQTDDVIPIFGLEISNSSLYAFSISFAYLVISLMLPILSGIADYSGRRLFFLKAFTFLGATSCICLFFFRGMPQLGLGLGCFIMATIGFDGGKVFYNSYLPLISSEDRYDQVSAKGFAFGYIGSVILLVINLVIIMNPQWLGISNGDLAVRLAFIMVGVWWVVFAQIPFRRLPADRRNQIDRKILKKGMQEIRAVWTALQPQKNTKRFLISFFCYSAGVQTILYLAATFAEKELSFATTELITIILILQVVAIGGAYLFAFVSKIRGNKFSLLVMLFIWISICIMAYLVQVKLQFYFIAALVGLVMGGIQSMSRSTYSKLIDEHVEDTTSYFSFYEVLEKLAIVFGTFSFGFIDQISGGMRNSVLVLATYFLLGILLLSTVHIEHDTKAQLRYS
ncbi:MAG: MFS transporter [Saprospiraceae bacterium]|nr:MFS transporter [Saprospiraceae bacterium]